MQGEKANLSNAKCANGMMADLISPIPPFASFVHLLLHSQDFVGPLYVKKKVLLLQMCSGPLMEAQSMVATLFIWLR